VTKTKVLVLVAVFVCILLLSFATNCSFDKKAESQSGGGSYYEVERSFVTNPYCLVCHLDFEGEQLVVDHEKARIGCERCHGESERHRSDEANVTPPEIMYPKERINPTCMMCHPRGEIEDVTYHTPLLAGARTIFDEAAAEETKEKYCTDCHGVGHRMNVHTVRWNKATGELLKAQ
jgi:hypothetical protein